ncbi:MAG: transporter substrate-binding domain-containing protein, partial [SAR324 cluster bacterium]|nr:transporter substrate-binding domain-containing protein [SAR324 cluster bacterium]
MLRIAFYDQAQPLFWVNAQGRPVGIFADIWKLWSKKTGVPVTFVPSSWPAALKNLKGGQADFHAGLFRTEERAKWLDFSRQLYALNVGLYARASASPPPSMESLKGQRVGVIRDSVQQTFLRKNHPEVVPAFFDTLDEAIWATAIGDVEAFFAAPLRMSLRLSNMGLADELRPTGEFLYSGEFVAGFLKGNAELGKLIEEGLGKITRAELAEIEARWVPDPAHRFYAQGGTAGKTNLVKLTREERRWLAQHPVIRVHNETDWPPFNFFEDGKPQGFSIDYMNFLASLIGVKVEFVSGPTWNEFLGMMKSGDLDVMLNIVKTPERQKYLLYTKAYGHNPNAILSHGDAAYENLEQLFGKTVSLPKGFFYEEILKRDFPRIKLHLVRNVAESMKAVVFGKADAAFGELSVFDYIIARDIMSGLVLSGEVRMGDPSYSQLNIATRKDLPVLAAILNKAMSAVTPEEVRVLRQRWISGAKTGSPRRKPQLTTEEKAWLAAHKDTKVRVMVGARPPFHFLENGKPQGLAIDYVKTILEGLGLKIEFVPI